MKIQIIGRKVCLRWKGRTLKLWKQLICWHHPAIFCLCGLYEHSYNREFGIFSNCLSSWFDPKAVTKSANDRHVLADEKWFTKCCLILRTFFLIKSRPTIYVWSWPSNLIYIIAAVFLDGVVKFQGLWWNYEFDCQAIKIGWTDKKCIFKLLLGECSVGSASTAAFLINKVK